MHRLCNRSFYLSICLSVYPSVYLHMLPAIDTYVNVYTYHSFEAKGRLGAALRDDRRRRFSGLNGSLSLLLWRVALLGFRVQSLEFRVLVLEPSCKKRVEVGPKLKTGFWSEKDSPGSRRLCIAFTNSSRLTPRNPKSNPTALVVRAGGCGC